MLLEHLTREEQALLRQPLWVTGVDMSFKMNGHAFLEGDIRGPLPILGGADDDPLIVFDQDLMKGVTDEAQAMVGRIVSVYKLYRKAIVLQPGQILLVDNVRAVHGRSPFSPNFGALALLCASRYMFARADVPRRRRGPVHRAKLRGAGPGADALRAARRRPLDGGSVLLDGRMNGIYTRRKQPQ